MFELFSVPNATTVVSNSTDYASTLTTSFLPLVWVVIGMVAAVALILFLRKAIGRGIRKVSKH